MNELSKNQLMEIDGGGILREVLEFAYGVFVEEFVGPTAAEMYANGQEPWGLGRCHM